MKIIYFYPKFTSATGTERILIDKMNYFSNQEGYEVLMLTYEQGNHPIVYPISYKIKHVDLGVRFCELFCYGKVPRFFLLRKYKNLLSQRLEAILYDYKPDIVISTTYYNEILSAIVSCKIPFVRILESHIDKRYMHNNDLRNRINVFHWFHSWYDMKWLNSKASKFDVLVALNKPDASDWSRYIKTVIIDNIVHMNPSNRISTQVSNHAIFVGRYTWQKGIKDLLKIWKLVYTKHPDWHLDMYGDGDMREYIIREVASLHSNIHVHASTTEIFDKYLDSSILLMTSNYEPFGLVMPEAMSCGLPVVAFDCPSGPANILTDGVDGFLIRNRDNSRFADKVCLLIESPMLRKKMGEAAIKSSKRYSSDVIMPMWDRLFHSLIEEKKK